MDGNFSNVLLYSFRNHFHVFVKIYKTIYSEFQKKKTMKKCFILCHFEKKIKSSPTFQQKW